MILWHVLSLTVGFISAALLLLLALADSPQRSTCAMRQESDTSSPRRNWHSPTKRISALVAFLAFFASWVINVQEARTAEAKQYNQIEKMNRAVYMFDTATLQITQNVSDPQLLDDIFPKVVLAKLLSNPDSYLRSEKLASSQTLGERSPKGDYVIHLVDPLQSILPGYPFSTDPVYLPTATLEITPQFDSEDPSGQEKDALTTRPIPAEDPKLSLELTIKLTENQEREYSIGSIEILFTLRWTFERIDLTSPLSLMDSKRFTAVVELDLSRAGKHLREFFKSDFHAPDCESDWRLGPFIMESSRLLVSRRSEGIKLEYLLKRKEPNVP